MIRDLPRKIACIGCGNVGRSWAVTFARAGCGVTLWDANEASAQAARDFVVNLHPEADIALAPDMTAAVGEAHYIQESIPENSEIKRQIFGQLDTLAPPGAIIASSTSAIPASILFADLATRSRCLIVHPVNPPHLIPLVELSPAPFTSADSVALAQSFMIGIGQSPILLKKEIEGFILNRLQWALLGEALHLVGEGYCEVDDIDRAVTDGLARRWPLLGPFAVGHLNASLGLAGYFEGLADAMGRVRASVRADYEPSAALKAELHEVLASRIAVEDIAAHQSQRDADISELAGFMAALSKRKGI